MYSLVISKMWQLKGLVGLFCLLSAAAAPMDRQTQGNASVFQLSDVVPLRGQFAQRAWNGTWLSDNEFTYRVAGDNAIYKFNVETLEAELFISNDLLTTLDTLNPILSPDGLYLLAASDPLQGFRYSSSARFALYNLETENITYVAEHVHLQLCAFDGVGHALAYVLDNNVFYQTNDGQAIQLTNDGIPGIIYNGVADWVYEEEVLYSGSALWFSPDGNNLAVASFNDTMVDTYTYYHYGQPGDMDGQYPELVELKYPKVGRTNPDVSLRSVYLPDVNSVDGINWVELPAPVDIVTEDHVLGSVTWPSANEVAAIWLNRRQNLSALHICDTVDGQCNTERVHAEPNGWIESSQIPTFSRSGDSFIELNWSYQDAGVADGWRHLTSYTRNAGGSVVGNPITAGRVTVTHIVGWNQERDYYLYLATEEDLPWRRQLYVTGTITACLSCDVDMPGGSKCAYATATSSPSAEYVSLVCQERDEPSVTVIMRVSDGHVLYTWQENLELRETLQEYLLPEILIDSVELEGGYSAPIRLYLPPGLDRGDVDTKYPMIINVYSGPNSQTVYDTFAVAYHSYITTNRRAIYCTMDGRGSGLKGQDMLFEINNGLGSVEIEDHIIILRHILERYQFIDRERVAMWGWSYGGYATLLTLQQDADELIKCGISVAPVTSWLYYDTIYTERYMGVPTEEDNLAGYQAGDVNRAAEQLRGKKFFLIHGNADDNVHYQNAMALTVALQTLDIEFDQMSYPDEAHSISGVTRHVYNGIDRFWVDCLDLD